MIAEILLTAALALLIEAQKPHVTETARNEAVALANHAILVGMTELSGDAPDKAVEAAPLYDTSAENRPTGPSQMVRIEGTNSYVSIPDNATEEEKQALMNSTKHQSETVNPYRKTKYSEMVHKASE